MIKGLLNKIGIGLLSAMLAFGPAIAFAQVNVPGQPINNPFTTALITDTLAAAGTVNSAAQNALVNRGVACTFNMSAHTGTPSTTFSIQNFDRISNSWITMVTSAAITADATPTVIWIYPGIQTASLPTGMVGSGLHVTRQWRVTRTVAGTTPAVTSTISCELLA